MILVVCGVSGAGKTTIGRLLADALRRPFFDGDDFHSDANKKKMIGGSPLTDEDRFPWLTILARNMSTWAGQGGAVIACSALKESYRNFMSSESGQDITWITLFAPKDVLIERLKARQDHFFDGNLLDSQLEAFEVPDYGIVVDVRFEPEAVVEEILARLVVEDILARL